VIAVEDKISILIVGSVNMDLVTRTKKAPVGGESVLAESYRYLPGGKGANQSVAAARLGAAAAFVGCVGNDAAGSELRANLVKEGVCVDFLETDRESGTGLANIIVEDNGQNRILITPGANMRISRDNLARAFERTYGAVMVQFEITRDIIIETARLANAHGIPLIVDAGPAMDFPLEELGRVAILSPNETEAEALTGLSSKADCGSIALALKKRCQADMVVLKRGALGAYVYKDGAGVDFPAYPVKAVDTTAAGDAFTAAMAVGYAKGGDISEVIRFANAAGALAVTKLGAQVSMPFREEVVTFLQNR